LFKYFSRNWSDFLFRIDFAIVVLLFIIGIQN
jgi:hypothetical protein